MGFRRGRSTTDSVFILSHLVQRGRATGEKARKIYAFFADLKAAFDNVDRDILWGILRKMKIREELIRKIEKIYERTEVIVRTEEGMAERLPLACVVRCGGNCGIAAPIPSYQNLMLL